MKVTVSIACSLGRIENTSSTELQLERGILRLGHELDGIYLVGESDQDLACPGSLKNHSPNINMNHFLIQQDLEQSSRKVTRTD